MKNNILLSNKEYVFNRFFSTNLYEYPDLQVFHFVAGGDAYDCEYSKRRKELYSLRNYINKNKIKSVVFDFLSLVDIQVKVICLSSLIINEGLKKGGVTLRFVQSNVVIGELKDTNEDGVLVQTVGPFGNQGDVAGLVLYEYGVVILFGSWVLNGAQENFRSMVTNYDGVPLVFDEAALDPRWVYFMNTGNSLTNACPNSVFEMDLETVSKMYKMTFFVDVENKNWSNNPTFHPRGGGLSFGRNFVAEVNDALGTGLNVVESEDKKVVLSSVDMYDSSFRKVGNLHLAQPLILDKKSKYKLKVEIDC